MHIVLGGTGHVGSAVAKSLLMRGEAVTVVTRNVDKAAELKQLGAQVAVADISDIDTLRAVFRQGERLFLLNPPAPPTTDTDAEELRSIHAILAAIEGSGLEKIVAESTYGATAGERIGDLGTLYALEQGLERQTIPVSVIRAAYYMTNWDFALDTARNEGVVHTMFPADFILPTVAPRDIGRIAADLMTAPAVETGVHFVEGPQRYNANDVAAAFAVALNKPVKAVAVSRAQWRTAYEQLGFSDAAAESYVGMTALALETPFPESQTVIKGTVTLQDYVGERIAGV